MPKMKKASQDSTNSTAASLGFEAKLWATADALRNNMDAAEFPFAKNANSENILLILKRLGPGGHNAW